MRREDKELRMLALTKKTGYGLIAMGHLAALARGEVASASAIARQFGVPQALLMNVLKELASAGFVQSVRGAGGKRNNLAAVAGAEEFRRDLHRPL